MTLKSEQVRLQTALYRAKQAGTPATLTIGEWKQSVNDFNELCAYCLQSPYEVLEHFIPVTIAGTNVKNCIPACRLCNRKKHDRIGDEVIALFGREVIERIQLYLASRTEISEEEKSQSDTHPHRVTGWSTWKKIITPLDQIRAYIPDQAEYSIDELFEYLTCTLVDLATMADIHIKTLTKIRYGLSVRINIIDKLLVALSQIYDRPLSLRNVTGINVQENKRLEKKEEKEIEESKAL